MYLGEKGYSQNSEEKNDNAVHSEVLVNPDFMNDAFQGENREHEMGLWEAAKNYPMACMWAFIMAFTIVSPRIRRGFPPYSGSAQASEWRISAPFVQNYG